MCSTAAAPQLHLTSPLKHVYSVTSAVPKMKQKPAEGQRPEMYFEEGGMPETVSLHAYPHAHM